MRPLVLLPYVDGNDPLWREDLERAGGAFQAERFRDWGMLRYVVRSYAKNMPWADVALIAARESQVPGWWAGRTVYHSDFVPGRYLPCFNVNTIEDYLWAIPGLPDRVVYANDDILAMKPTSAGDYFDGDRPRVNVGESDGWTQNVFRRFCRNSMDVVSDALGAARYDGGKLLKPTHSMTPITGWQLEWFGANVAPVVERERMVTRVREARNVNQYAYTYAAVFSGKASPSPRACRYVDMDTGEDAALAEIAEPSCDLLCLNDNGRVIDYAGQRNRLVAALEAAFPERCGYER